MKKLVDELKNSLVLDSAELRVAEWTADGARLPSQVHIVNRAAGDPPVVFIIRLKSRAACAELIAALIEHMEGTWPQS